MSKMSKMQEVAAVLERDGPEKGSKLAASIRDSIKYVEESAYTKLVKLLKNKIRMFDTPLENQPEFLVFMKVTLKMLKEKSIEMYGHIMNELIKSRSKYSELSFNEKMNFIYQEGNSKAKKPSEPKLSNAKNVAATIAWLHETLVNEVQIIDHTALDKSRYLDVLNSIFSREISKKLK